MPIRSANAVWNKGLKDGNGTMSFSSGAYEGAYSFASRFEEGTGTNPEELIAAAHAGCFSMALAAGLERAGFPPESVETTAKVKLEKGDAGFAITHIQLNTEAVVPGIEEDAFQEQVKAAKEGCPVSQALKAVDVDADATLKNS